jgi:hypothetical protein
VDAAVSELDEDEDVEALRRDRLDGEEIDGEHALGLLPQKHCQVSPPRLPAGPRPASLRIFVADTRKPSPVISPAIRW